MSIFDTQDQGDGNVQQTQQTQTESWLEKIVADKGEQFRDPEALAKSLFNANMHIKTLEDENSQYKERSVKEDFGKELLDALRKQQPASGEHTQTEQKITGGSTEETTQTGPEDIKKLVEEAITNREYARSREQNIAEADAQMRRLFGDQAQAELTKRARELGVEVEYLAEVAGKSPTAFLRMLGEKPQVENNELPRAATNTASFTHNPGKRNWAYYKNLMKQDPKKYRSKQVQDQIERDYAEQGSNFWVS